MSSFQQLPARPTPTPPIPPSRESPTFDRWVIGLTVTVFLIIVIATLWSLRLD